MPYRRSWARDFERSVRDNPDWPVLVSHGDSWFSFPEEPNVIDQLDGGPADGKRGRKGGCQRPWALLRMENGSDELATMLTSSHRAELRTVLDRSPVQALLFSAGGNDLVGADLLSLLLPYTAGAQAADCIHEERLARRLRRLEDCYRDLVDLALDDGGDLRIFVNSYDYPVASDRPAKLLGSKVNGPWLRPAFQERGYPDGDPLIAAVPRLLIDRFCQLIDRLAVECRGRVVRVETRGAVGSDWADEIHPNGEAARRVADRFARALVKGRVIS